MAFLFYFLLIWLLSGFLANILKTFVLFRGPTHMLTLYLLHPRTRKGALIYLAAARRNSPNAIVFNVVVTSIIVSMVLSPLAIIELLLDTYTFWNFTPPKQEKENE